MIPLKHSSNWFNQKGRISTGRLNLKNMNKVTSWPTWGSTKTLNAPPPIGTLKLQLFTEQLLMRNTGKLAENIFYN